MPLRTAATFTLVIGLLTSLVTAQARLSSYDEVRSVLAPLAEILPEPLRTASAAEMRKAWTDWAARHDRDIRSRLQRGDEETIVNWLLFGTSFTKQPRVVFRTDSPELDQATSELVVARAADLAAALAAPGQDERRLFARDLFEREGLLIGTVTERARLTARLVELFQRVVRERESYARETEAIRRIPDVSDQFAARSKLFRDRGLSLDTSFRPSFALEKTLEQLRQRGLLKPGTIQDVAVIGPGLDFTDKNAGYDFYPQQTIQPFTVIDSLLRVGLASNAERLRLTTLDLSPRVNDHLRRALARAARGESYRFRLPIERDVKWKPGVVNYWRVAGDRIGSTTSPQRAMLAGADVDVRTVAVRPAVARRLEPLDLNIVVQRSDSHRFDLIVATNVFIYYDTLDQVLALANVRSMLRPGGFLLSNNALLELPGSGVRSLGYLTVEYSEVPDDGDHVVWYQAE